MVDKEKAIVLRSSGMKYKDISKELNCSEAWCKVNLSKVEITGDVTILNYKKNVSEFLKIITENGRMSYDDICKLFYGKSSTELTEHQRKKFKLLTRKLKKEVATNIENIKNLNDKYGNVQIVEKGGKFEVYKVYSEQGELLYIGSGRLNRHRHVFSGKSHVEYLNTLIETENIFVTVDQSFNTKRDSLDLETRLIATLFPSLNDKGNWKNQFIHL